MSPQSTRQAHRHKNFYRAMDDMLRQIDRGQGLQSMLSWILAEVTRVFGDQVGITSGRLYRSNGDEYEVVQSFGSRGEEILGFKVPGDYAILAELGSDEVRYYAADHHRVDPQLENRLGVTNFAVFYVGPDREYLASFGVAPDADPEEVMVTLNTLRYAVQHRLKEMSLEGQLKEVRSIQVSLLPQRAPQFEGFELAGLSLPAEEVGGDIFDFIELDPHLLGVAVGDASGHGLPAALQARDVVTGLRMGVQDDLKITAVLRKLNRVIHKSGLTSRFVSLLYGELETGGNFFYVNAGHETGLLLRATGGREHLRSTGLVMGPVENVHYRRGLAHLNPGDLLVLYTDGVVERALGDDQYGLRRLEDAARALMVSDVPVAEMPARLLEEAHAFGGDDPPSDDATLVLVRRQPR